MRYCCDGNCQQGRDCPAVVAKVGQRYPKYIESAPPSLWRERLRDLARWMLYALLSWLVWGSALLFVIK